MHLLVKFHNSVPISQDIQIWIWHLNHNIPKPSSEVMASRITGAWNSEKLFYTYYFKLTLTARFMGPTWGPHGTDRTQVAPWTLLSGNVFRISIIFHVKQCRLALLVNIPSGYSHLSFNHSVNISISDVAIDCVAVPNAANYQGRADENLSGECLLWVGLWLYMPFIEKEKLKELGRKCRMSTPQRWPYCYSLNNYSIPVPGFCKIDDDEDLCGKALSMSNSLNWPLCYSIMWSMFVDFPFMYTSYDLYYQVWPVFD